MITVSKAGPRARANRMRDALRNAVLLLTSAGLFSCGRTTTDAGTPRAARTTSSTAPGATVAPTPSWKTHILKRLKCKVSAGFSDMPVDECPGPLETLLETPIMMEESAREACAASVTQRITDTPASEAPGRVAGAAGLHCAVIDHAIYVGSRSRIGEVMRIVAARRRRALRKDMPEWEREIRRKLTRSVTTDWPSVRLEGAVWFLESITRTSIVSGPAYQAAGDRRIPLSVADTPAESVLSWLTIVSGFDYDLIDRVVFIGRRTRVEELRRLSATRRSRAARKDMPQWEREIRRKLTRAVTFEFVETPLSEAMQFLQTATGVGIAIDKKAGVHGDTPVSLRVEDIPTEAGLAWTARAAGLEPTYSGGLVLLTTPADVLRGAGSAASGSR